MKAYHYLIAVNYSKEENSPASSAVMSPHYCDIKLSQEDTVQVYKILSDKINIFLSEKEHTNKDWYKEIRIFRIEKFTEKDLIAVGCREAGDIEENMEETKALLGSYYNVLLMAFKDYDAFLRFGEELKTLNI